LNDILVRSPTQNPDRLAETGAATGCCDPVTLEIIRGALRATQSEMEALIERTAMSPFIREKKDFYAALFDEAGRLIVGSNLPIFGDVIGPIAEIYPLNTMRLGDIYWYNDCYASRGAVSHSPDQVFACPVFCDGELVAFAQSWAHFNDIGGMRAGSLSPDCEEIFQEGIIVPPVRIARDGHFNDELLRVFVRNSRFPAMALGDTRASIAAIRLGERRLIELFERFGRERMRDAFEQLLARTYPVRLRRYAINPDSGGPGRWRGGCGIVREFELLASIISVRIDIGGTSADITLVHDGEPGLTTSGHIGDWPLGLPMIDITTAIPTPLAGVGKAVFAGRDQCMEALAHGGYPLLDIYMYIYNRVLSQNLITHGTAAWQMGEGQSGLDKPCRVIFGSLRSEWLKSAIKLSSP
jgi:N-methylhydantoinase B/oxoprolinase/acetone carboxylase alpha subunit